MSAVGALVALLVAFLTGFLTLISGTYLAISLTAEGPPPADDGPCAVIHDGWRFVGGIGMISAGALVLGILSIRAFDGRPAGRRVGGIVGIGLCLLGLSLAVVRNEAFACLRDS